MRARAQRNRWEEEFTRTKYEMIWVTLYFINQRDRWYDRLRRLSHDGERGLRAYSEEMIYRWEEFARIADFQFRAVNSELMEIWKPLIRLQ